MRRGGRELGRRFHVRGVLHLKGVLPRLWRMRLASRVVLFEQLRVAAGPPKPLQINAELLGVVIRLFQRHAGHRCQHFSAPACARAPHLCAQR